MRSAVLFLLAVSGCVSSAPSPARARPSGPPFQWVVDEVSGAGLMGTERAQARQLVARWLEANGYSVIEASAQPVFAASQGRDPRSGEACGLPLTGSSVVRRWGSALGLAGVVSSSVWCTREGCKLTVANGSEAGAFRFEAPLDPALPRLEALTKGVALLAPPRPAPPGFASGVLGSGGSSVRDEDRLVVIAHASPPRLEPRKLELEGSLEQTLTCLGPDDSGEVVRVEADAAGAVIGCERASSSSSPAVACLCQALKDGNPRVALANERWEMSFRVERRDRRTPDGRFILSGWWNTHFKRSADAKDVALEEKKRGAGKWVPLPRFEERVEDPSLAGWTPGPSRIAVTCFERVATVGPIASRWAVWFDARGNATKAVEQATSWPRLAPEIASCVARALLTAQAPCPSRAGLWAMADLHVALRDPSAPPTNVFGPGGLGTGITR